MDDLTEKFIRGFKEQSSPSDIIVFNYVLNHRYCNLVQIKEACGEICGDVLTPINHYIDLGLIMEEDEQYYC